MKKYSSVFKYFIFAMFTKTRPTIPIIRKNTLKKILWFFRLNNFSIKTYPIKAIKEIMKLFTFLSSIYNYFDIWHKINNNCHTLHKYYSVFNRRVILASFVHSFSWYNHHSPVKMTNKSHCFDKIRI